MLMLRSPVLSMSLIYPKLIITVPLASPSLPIAMIINGIRIRTIISLIKDYGNLSMSHLSQLLDVIELLHVRSQRVNDGHVVVLLQQHVLQVLEDGDGVTEKHLK